MTESDPQTDGWSGVPPRATPAAHGREARVAPDTSADSDRGGAGAGAAGRPAPQYGEYAPVGWVNPVLAEQERQEQRDREHAAASAAASAARSNGTARPNRSARPDGSGRSSQVDRGQGTRSTCS
jgi:hypothetical protein